MSRHVTLSTSTGAVLVVFEEGLNMAAIVSGFGSWVARAIQGKGVKIETLEETPGRTVLRVTDSGKVCRITIEELD